MNVESDQDLTKRSKTADNISESVPHNTSLDPEPWLVLSHQRFLSPLHCRIVLRNSLAPMSWRFGLVTLAYL